MQKSLRILVDICLLLAVLAASIMGLFSPVEHALNNLRFELATRDATGEVVFVAVDPASLRDVGVWPWPRSIHAELTDQLVALDAADIFFDIDFSAPSNSKDDAVFAGALERAGGYVGLAAFAQTDTVSSDGMSYNVPIPEFAANTQVATVNVRPDPDGVVRKYPRGGVLARQLFPSIATLLAYVPPEDSEFVIDYGIDASTIDQISYADIRAGNVDPQRIAGKQIIVGAAALELRDSLTVPRYGILPGALLQAIAVETLKQDRVLVDHRTTSGIALAIILAFLFVAFNNKKKAATVVGFGALGALALEAAAYYLQAVPAILIDTVPSHATLITLSLAALAREINLWQLLARKTKHEHDFTQGILDRVIADNFDGVVVVGTSGNILAASQFASEVLGFDTKRIKLGLLADDVLPPVLAAEIRVGLQMFDEGWPVVENNETEITDMNGATRVVEYVITLSSAPQDQFADEREVVACLTFRDITLRRAQEKRLSYLATHDPLTGALSRARLTELITGTLATEDGTDFGLTLGIFNLSRFKTVNDTLGHASGDALLKRLVERLKHSEIDTVARLGGDSFAVVRAGVLGEKETQSFCRRLLATVSEIYIIGDHRALVGAQLGITNSDLSGTDPDTLIAHADMALSAAKESPLNNFAVYVPVMNERLREAQAMEVALRNALKKDEFSLLFQPQNDLENGEVIGVEALLRWTNPELGAVPPDKFIAIAEETGVILDLGRWVLIEACRAATSWPKPINLAVNVSPTQLEYGDVVADVREALKTTGLAPDRLEIEITEGVFISKEQFVTKKLTELKAMGVKIALDDFGTGFSSLSYLGKLPIDKIKIDRAFVKDLPQDQHSIAVVRAVMTLSESLGKKVVAEGIENNDQAWMLHLAGCHFGQGYFYGKPLANSDIVARLRGGTHLQHKRFGS